MEDTETLSHVDTFFVSSQKQWYNDDRNINVAISVLLHGPLPNRVAQVDKITCSSRHCVAVSRLGIVFTWGNGSEGALGHGNFEDISRPRAVEHFLRRTTNDDDEDNNKEERNKGPPIIVTTVSAGSCTDGSHTACITNDGELFMFGLGKS